MSAVELLEKVKALPEVERRAFFRLLQKFEEQKNGQAELVPKSPIAWPDIEARHRRILGDAVLPENVVLAARREERG